MDRMIQHNANGMKFLLVEVPEIKGEFDILFTSHTMDMANPIYLVDKVGGGRTIICKLGEPKDFNGELTILGIASELTEEQAKMVVKKLGYKQYERYNSKIGLEFTTAIGSLKWLCRSHNLDPNRTLIIQIK